MTDGDPTSEIGEEPEKKLVQKLVDKTAELLDGQNSEKYFLLHTDEGDKVARVWLDADRERYLDGIIKREANVYIFALFDGDVDALEKEGTTEYEELVIIKSKLKKPVILLNKNRTPLNDATSDKSGNLLKKLFPRNTNILSPKVLKETQDSHRTSQEDLLRFTNTISEIQNTDSIPEPEFYWKKNFPFDPTMN